MHKEKFVEELRRPQSQVDMKIKLRREIFQGKNRRRGTRSYDGER